MSSSENSSLSSDSSSDDSNTIALNQWEERVSQQNHQIYTIFENMLSNIPNLTAGVQASRVRKRYCDRQREIGAERLINDYFGPNPTYGPKVFRHRFRMHKSVFLRIVEAVTANDEYFQERRDAARRQSLSSLQKCTGAMRVLAYGTSSDVVDEYLRMSSTATRDSLMHFIDGVISCFGATYLRRPTEQDMARLLYVADQRGFPGMIGSIDCMHWQWKNCPNAWAGQYTGRSGKPTIILEAVASYDLWIWHAFFGTPGSCNDINVLPRSPVFDDVLEGRAPYVNYVVNGHQYNRAYYLTDGIYPAWATFVKSITYPQTQKHKLFAQHQESIRKDVERVCGVLQARFAFLRRPCLVWDKILMGKIMMACIIMHNMTVEDERDTYQNYYYATEFIQDTHTRVHEENVEAFRYSTQRIGSLSSYMTNRAQLRNREAHIAL
ncbi:uncharacterized protein LOC121755167 [Salvia splendens]|uniref:uncharacterized protein LOC121755167 n=1 Tax=Salvia splendens TaxID=180675 RepID=UPI001C27FB41|nr:uncharacterized protein LOC121755167 [Salvia splendens]